MTETYAEIRTAAVTMAGSRIEFVDLVLGCACLGAVPIPLNSGLRGGGAGRVRRAGQVLEPLDLVPHCAEELPPFAAPRHVDTVRELPLTETGKVRKGVLRERGVTGTTWDGSTPPTSARHQT
ncbi:hypothetical protein ACFWOB_39600 [Streptomyces sp. NPDC058420]|uniref:AMP-binding enzyme n=1 Tax=Streptomyces sp. NPDC058420 TaxID=3346489 RepID=UPI00366A388C